MSLHLAYRESINHVTKIHEEEILFAESVDALARRLGRDTERNFEQKEFPDKEYPGHATQIGLSARQWGLFWSQGGGIGTLSPRRQEEGYEKGNARRAYNALVKSLAL